MGIYAGLKFSNKSIKDLQEFMASNKIDNIVPINKLHVTLLYSRKYDPNYKAAGKLDKPYICKPKNFDVWDNSENGGKSLVLKLDCPKLVERFKYLMKKFNLLYDYDKYQPHVTLSYDVGNIDIKNLKLDIPDLELIEEYQDELELDWQNNNLE